MAPSTGQGELSRLQAVSRNEAGSAGRTVEVTSMAVEVTPDEIRNWQAAKAQ